MNSFQILLEKYFISLHIDACRPSLSKIIDICIKEKIYKTKLHIEEMFFSGIHFTVYCI